MVGMNGNGIGNAYGVYGSSKDVTKADELDIHIMVGTINYVD